MVDRFVKSNVLTDLKTSNLFNTTPPGGNAIVTITNELLQSLKAQGLNYLHYTNNGEAGIAVIASRHQTISNDVPDFRLPLAEQIMQGLVGISQINRSGIRLGEGGPVYTAAQIIRGERQAEGTGAILQDGIDITDPPAPNGPRTLLPSSTAVAPPVVRPNRRGLAPN